MQIMLSNVLNLRADKWLDSQTDMLSKDPPALALILLGINQFMP